MKPFMSFEAESQHASCPLEDGGRLEKGVPLSLANKDLANQVQEIVGEMCTYCICQI
jgi:hypothetical protein